jgi:uncharacterized protein (DUF2267 family)
MPIGIREDVAYILLKKINESGQGMHEVSFTEADLAGRRLTRAELLGHLDYLNQKQFIKAEFTGNAYANQEDTTDLVNPQEFDFRIANSYDPKDGLLPHLITFKAAELTEKGRKILQRMEDNPPQALEEGPAVPIATEDMPFLEKVMIKANLEDIFDARDATEVVFRTMRDMMTTEAAGRVAEELHEPMEPTEDKALQNEIADLWKDTNPITRWLSRVRPPLKIKSGTFLFRINQEAGLPRAVGGESLTKAVFSATKDELSEERIQEIASFLPDEIRQLWSEA